MNHEIVVLCCLAMVFSITGGIFLPNVIQGYQKSYILGPFWVLCLSNCRGAFIFDKIGH